jgi:ParB family chromosome partitioning protein
MASTIINTPSEQIRGSHIARVHTASVQDNHALALSVNRRDVDRCIKVIRQYGLLTPPVVGSLADGGQLLLSGECEFLALREIGVKSVDAVTVPIKEKNEGDQLSLMLSSLKKSQCALSEGILISRLSKTGGYTQTQIGDLLGKSASWVNKRISLVTRLRPSVQELVTKGLLCPQSAQEIARLPAEVQHCFSIAAAKESVPKSAIGVLVTAYNAPGSSVGLKEQIVKEPRQALAWLADARSVKKIGRRPADADPIKQEHRLNALQRHMAEVTRDLHVTTAEGLSVDILGKLRGATTALLFIINFKMSFSLGKKDDAKGGE